MSSIFSFFRKNFLNCANRLWPVADGAGNGIARLADQARCQEEILRIDLPEHADHANSVAHLSGRVTHRRGNRAQTDLELPVFHGVALLADLLKLGLELLRGNERMGRIGLELGNGQEPAALRLREVDRERIFPKRTAL